MEAREILIANTRTQKRDKLTTDATTLGELKAAMSAANIPYDGLSFTEGITKTELLSDDTQLPHDVMYKGNVTNSLVILLTNTRKKIESGMGTRAEAYQMIYENELQQEIKEDFGRNFTQVPTSDLWMYLEDHGYILDEDEDEDEEEEEEDNTQEEDTPSEECNEECRSYNFRKSTLNMILIAGSCGAISFEDFKGLVEDLNDLLQKAESKHISMKVGDTSVTSDDVDDMIASL